MGLRGDMRVDLLTVCLARENWMRAVLRHDGIGEEELGRSSR